MTLYKVQISKYVSADEIFEIESESQMEAEMKALDLARNHKFSCYSEEYEIEYVEKV